MFPTQAHLAKFLAINKVILAVDVLKLAELHDVEMKTIHYAKVLLFGGFLVVPVLDFPSTPPRAKLLKLILFVAVQEVENKPTFRHPWA